MGEPTEKTTQKTSPDKTPAEQTNILLRQLLSRFERPLITDRLKSTGTRTATLNVGSTSPQMIAMENKKRRKLTIKNSHGSAVNLTISESRNFAAGGSNGSGGFTLKQNESITLEFNTSEWWGIADSSTILVTVIEE